MNQTSPRSVSVNGRDYRVAAQCRPSRSASTAREPGYIERAIEAGLTPHWFATG